MLVGLGAALLASICFGSTFVPIKKSPPTDGFVVQFFLVLGGLLVAVVIHAMQGFPQLYALPMLGGFIWCIANAFAIKIMNQLGMAVAMLIWNAVSCITGWATSRYGLFGLQRIEPASKLLNYIGVGVLIFGSVFYMFVRSNPSGKKGTETSADEEETKEKTDLGEQQEESTTPSRWLFIIFALISGLFYGCLCTPTIFVQSHNGPDSLFPGAPSSGLPYVLPFFFGTFFTSLVIFVIYSILNPTSQLIDGRLALRSIFGGMIFGVGISLFFLANELLSPTVAYPLIVMTPGLVVSLWSILYFQEITGRRNLIFLTIAYAITLVGVALVAVSKEVVL